MVSQPYNQKAVSRTEWGASSGLIPETSCWGCPVRLYRLQDNTITSVTATFYYQASQCDGLLKSTASREICANLPHFFLGACIQVW